VVVASFRLIAPKAESRGVAVVEEIPADLPCLRADERRLKQIVLNLLSNAVKFTPKNGTVTISSHISPDGRMVITVADTGIGMDAADITKALSLFGQVDSGLTRSQEGSGLGLPLTKSLVELHGGALGITSENGVGTTVTVSFPAERVEAV
jgi:signal transduction histidine kinase